MNAVLNGPVYADASVPVLKPGPIGTHITIRGLTKYFAGWPLYEKFDLDIPKHKIVSVFGPNGCGKSTLINMPARAIGRGDVSALEVTEASIARIERSDGSVNAFTGKTYARARREAAAVDAQRARGETLASLAGVPDAVKNLFDIQGEVTLAGSKINRSHAPAASDAFLVTRLQAAGAVLMGSLNMDEYAYGFTT